MELFPLVRTRRPGRQHRRLPSRTVDPPAFATRLAGTGAGHRHPATGRPVGRRDFDGQRFGASAADPQPGCGANPDGLVAASGGRTARSAPAADPAECRRPAASAGQQAASVGDQTGASNRRRLTPSRSLLKTRNRRVSTRHPNHRGPRSNRACWASPGGVRWTGPSAGRNAAGRSPGPALRRPDRRRKAGLLLWPGAQRWGTPGSSGWSPVSAAIARPTLPGRTDRIDGARRRMPSRTGRPVRGAGPPNGPDRPRGSRHDCDLAQPEQIPANHAPLPRCRPHRGGEWERRTVPPTDLRSTPRGRSMLNPRRARLLQRRGPKTGHSPGRSVTPGRRRGRRSARCSPAPAGRRLCAPPVDDDDVVRSGPASCRP